VQADMSYHDCALLCTKFHYLLTYYSATIFFALCMKFSKTHL